MAEQTAIRYERDTDGIVTLTFDEPNGPVNLMNDGFRTSLTTHVDRLYDEVEDIAGVILVSAKKTFFAGGDLKRLAEFDEVNGQQQTQDLEEIKRGLRRLEQLGKPVVAAINGAALGGGLELALAAHHRIAADAPGSRIGLPEVSRGLLPGGGGITRVVRMLGLQKAVSEVILPATMFKVRDALAMGLIDEVVDTVDQLDAAARAWIAANPAPVKPWDVKGFKLPGGAPTSPAVGAMLPAMPAALRKQLKGSPLPAPRAALAAAVEGAYVDFETASQIEGRYFVSLVSGQIAKNMIKANFFDLSAISKGASRPQGFDRYRPAKVGVVGAGMMGAAIAYVTAKAGIDVVLKDVSIEAAERGKDYGRGLEAKAIERGRTTAADSEALLSRVTTTGDYADFEGVDFVIEAVFENMELKHSVFRELEPIVTADAVLGSNTSTLPITEIASSVSRRGDFIGIHFFSPVDKMQLVEIVRGEETSDEVLAKVFDYVLAIGKVPIVVNDSRGFFTSRVIGRFLEEAMAMVGEGIEPASIEQAGLQAGYPAAPLQLIDELALTLWQRITGEARAAVESSGGQWHEHLSERVNKQLIELERTGKKDGRGFYDYDQDGRRVGIWPQLREIYDSGSTSIPFEDMKERFLFAEAIDSINCFDEGVLTSVIDANVGSILGIGYPIWTGGVLQYVNQYAGGLQGFVNRARELESRYGSRFTPPASLVERAAKNEPYV